MKEFVSKKQNLHYMGLILLTAIVVIIDIVLLRRIEAGKIFSIIGAVSVIAGAAVCAFSGWLVLYKKTEIEKVFVLLSLVFGSLIFAVLPTYTKPDEIGHFATAYEISNNMLGQEDTVAWETYYMRICDAQEYEGKLSEKLYNTFYGKLGLAGEKKALVLVDCKSTRAFASYVISAMGISLARILGLDFGWCAIFGSFFNLLAYTLICWFCLKILPVGKRMFFAVMLMPMSLQMASSFNYDSILIPACFLVISLGLHWYYQPIRQYKWNELILFAVACVVLFSAKNAAYSPLLIFMFAMLWRKSWFNSKAKKLGWAIFIVVVIVLIAYVMKIGGFLILQLILCSWHYVDWACMYAQPIINYILDPSLYFKVMFETAKQVGPEYLSSMVGDCFGEYNIYIPKVLVIIEILMLIFASISSKDDKNEITGRVRAQSLIIGILLDLIAITAMLILWTPVLSPYVRGFQGRYLIPTLPLILLGVGYWKKPKFKFETERIVMALMPILIFAVITIGIWKGAFL